MNKVNVSMVGVMALFLASCGGPEVESSSSEEVMVDSVVVDDHATHDHGSNTDAGAEFLEYPAGSEVFFVNLSDGQIVPQTFKVVMGLEGMTVHPAGEMLAGTGHHHIIIDGGFEEKGSIVPSDEKNIHFGGGQTEAELTLSPGEHTLTLQFANGAHMSYGEELSRTIKVIVAE
jgi:hypothetical protein